MQPLDVGGVAGEHAQDVIGLARRQETFIDLGHGADRLLEGAQVAVGLGLEGDAHHHAHAPAELREVELGGVALDVLLVLEPAHTPQAGRLGEADARGEFGVRDAALEPKLVEDPQVDGVERQFHARIARFTTDYCALDHRRRMFRKSLRTGRAHPFGP